MLVTIITFVLVLAILVLVHEFGHFYAARKAGVRVEEFGFGFPPRLFGIKKGDTLYSFNLLPLGGFVRLYGEDDPDLGSESFGSKSLGVKSIIISAGVIANMLLAFLIFTIVAAIGAPTAQTETNGAFLENAEVRITFVAENSPAAMAGMNVADNIIELRGVTDAQKVTSIDQVQTFIGEHLTEEVQIFVKRGDEVKVFAVVPRADAPPEEGAVGFGMIEIGFARTPWYLAPVEGVRRSFELLFVIFAFLWELVSSPFTGGGSDLAGSVSGPVGIASIVGDSLRFGFVYLLEIIGLLSINLAVLNILPIPALDGGRLAFFVVEKIRGKAISDHIPRIAHSVGFVLLLLILVVVTYRDIIRLL